MPARIKSPDYPGHFEVRKVSTGGCIKFKNRFIFVSQALEGEYVGLEEVDSNIWSVHFYNTLLARFNENNYKLT